MKKETGLPLLFNCIKDSSLWENSGVTLTRGHIECE